MPFVSCRQAYIYLDGVPLSSSSGLGGAFQFKVTAGTTPDLTLSYVADNALGANGLYAAIAGAAGTFLAFPVDAFGNAMLASSTTCSASLTCASAAVAASVTCAATSITATSFTISYVAYSPGSYTQSVLLPIESGTALTTGIAASLVVVAGPLRPLLSTLGTTFTSSDGTTALTSGPAFLGGAYIAIQAVDTSNASMTTGGATFQATITSGAASANPYSATVAPVDGGDGTYKLWLASASSAASQASVYPH